MTKSEIAELLALIAGCDQRTVGEADVEAWWAISQEEGWTWETARRAVIEYHRAGADAPRMKPGHVTDLLRATELILRRRLFRADITPPKELRDRPVQEEIAWRRAYMQRALSDAMRQWGETGELPDSLPQAPELDAVSRPQLQAAIQRLANQKRVN